MVLFDNVVQIFDTDRLRMPLAFSHRMGEERREIVAMRGTRKRKRNQLAPDAPEHAARSGRRRMPRYSYLKGTDLMPPSLIRMRKMRARMRKGTGHLA